MGYLLVSFILFCCVLVCYVLFVGAWNFGEEGILGLGVLEWSGTNEWTEG